MQVVAQGTREATQGRSLVGGSNCHHNRFARRCVAAFGHAIQWDENIRLREVRRNVPLRDFIWHDVPFPCMQFSSLEVRGQVDQVAFRPVIVIHIRLIHQDDPASFVDASVPIIQSIYRRIVLVVGTDGHHKISTSSGRGTRQVMDTEVSVSRLSGECPAIPRRIGQVEAAIQPDPLILTLESGNAGFDHIPDFVIVLREVLPSDSTSSDSGIQSACDARND